jgi:deazaflavin-dependent oxidoreductase (nitroreductase family)
MTKFLIKVFMALNTFVIRASRGRLGTLLWTQTVLLLHTVGRRSGRHFVTPISYFSVDGYYFLVGSNWGRPHNAAWYYNLLSSPHTTVEVKGKEIPVEAFPARGQEYDNLWDLAVQRYPGYRRYKQTTKRHIPIVKLVPEGTRTEHRE